jgi:mevalonate kinase
MQMKTQQRTANKTTDIAQYSAPGKLILCGEHAVVYGYPAIISSINRFFTWKIKATNAEHIRRELAKKIDALLSFNSLDAVISYIQTLFPKAITVESTIPQGSGLGSSAAIGVSLAKLLLPNNTALKDIRELALSFEEMQHGNPSGGDITASCYGGLIWYQKNLAKNAWSFDQLEINTTQTLPSFWLLNSGQPKESTKTMVEQVASLHKKRKKDVDAAFSQMEQIAISWKELLSQPNADVKSTQESVQTLLNENQKALQTIGVCSTKALDSIESLKEIGAAAKVTGAGGVEDGSGMILITHPDPEKIYNWAKKNKSELLPITLATGGNKNA